MSNIAKRPLFRESQSAAFRRCEGELCLSLAYAQTQPTISKIADPSGHGNDLIDMLHLPRSNRHSQPMQPIREESSHKQIDILGV